MLVSGCTGSIQNNQPTADNYAPGTQQIQQASILKQTYACPDGLIVTNLSDCPRCPASCDDNNSCTSDFCNLTTNFTCEHIELNDTRCGVNGICDNGVCKESVSNGTAPSDSNETVLNESQAPCVLNDSICEPSCKTDMAKCLEPCMYHSNVGSGISSVACQKSGCLQKFDDSADCITQCDAHTEDNVCPKNCSAVTDIDCPVYNSEEYVYSKDGAIKMFATTRCMSNGYTAVQLKIWNMGKTDLSIKNTDFVFYSYDYTRTSLDAIALNFVLSPGQVYELDSGDINGKPYHSGIVFVVHAKDGRLVFSPTDNHGDDIVIKAECD